MADLPEGTGDAFGVLAQFFVNEGTLGDTLLRVAQLACQHSPADMAGITMLIDGTPGTAVFTDPEALEIDESQYTTGQGPCLDAFRNQAIFRIDSTSNENRWPEFAKVASAHGIRSTLSLPIIARAEGLGALNLYSRDLAAFDDKAADRMMTFARHAAIVLANTQVYWDARQLSENLEQALHSRSTIDYAIGILIGAGGRSPEEAFQILVRASQRENRKLREIANEIVEHASNRNDIGDANSEAG